MGFLCGSVWSENDQGVWGFAATSSMTMETMAVTKAMAWLKTQSASYVCILSDSMGMLKIDQSGCLHIDRIYGKDCSVINQIHA